MELDCKNISVEISGKKILEEINLKVEDGELISLLGASGCGKSTLLKTIAGLIDPQQGSVFFNGRNVNHLPAHKRKAVIVFQDFRLFPHMTALENISFPQKIQGLSKDEMQKRSLQLLGDVQLEGFENRYLDQMSGGQIQRVALARALAAQPDILLLDEPFSSLDVNLRRDMRNLVLKLHKDYKMTTILVTHDQEEALAMSEKIAFMSEGQILQFDRPAALFNKPAHPLVSDYMADMRAGAIFDSDSSEVLDSTDFQIIKKPILIRK